MKKLFFASLAAMLMLFAACQNSNDIVGPQPSQGKYTVQAEPNWIGLPKAADGSLAKKFKTLNHITRAHGGSLTIDETYTTLEGTEVHAFSSIAFAPGVVRNDCDITMEIDDNTGVSTFLPHQMFDADAILNQVFTGLNLSNIDVSSIELYYLAEDGTYEVMQRDALIIDTVNGTITVVNGRIPHFSLYGFGL